MSEPKTQETNANVDDFLQSVPDGARRSDAITLAALIQQVTGESPRMWGDSIVGFGKRRYRYASGKENDWFSVGFSPRKDQLAVYFMSHYQDHPALQNLGKYKLGKGCLYIKKMSDVDTAALVELIRFAWDHKED